MKLKYTVMHVTRDPNTGATIHERFNMREYTLATAKRIADATRGAFVTPLGKMDPVYVGDFR